MCSRCGATAGSCNEKAGKRNLRVTIIYFGRIQIKAKSLLEILGIEPGAHIYKLKTITLS